MKYVRMRTQAGDRFGILKGETVFTLTAPPWDGGVEDGGAAAFSEADLLCPCAPSKIVCVGKNYYDHIMEFDAEVPQNCVLFLKPSTSVVGPGDVIEKPAHVGRLDFECELAVVIRKRARHVRKEDAADYILGYTCLNDVTARDLQMEDGQWARAKSMDTFCPIGPVITDEIDPSDVLVESRLNGALRQSGRTSQMIYDIPFLLSYITQSMTLLPGDVIATGTPSGIGPMEDGDIIEVKVEGIGALTNTVTAKGG